MLVLLISLVRLVELLLVSVSCVFVLVSVWVVIWFNELVVLVIRIDLFCMLKCVRFRFGIC